MEQFKLEIFYLKKLTITYVNKTISLSGLDQTIRALHLFNHNIAHTICGADAYGYTKILSEETFKSVKEFSVNYGESILTIFIVTSTTDTLVTCTGQDYFNRSIKFWKIQYFVNGHHLKFKFYNFHESCKICKVRISNVSTHAFICIYCQILVHDKCHKNTQMCVKLDSVENVSHPSVLHQHQMSATVENKIYSVADFNILKLIGEGTYSQLFVAQLKADKEICAMKVIGKEYTLQSTWTTEKKVYLEVKKFPFLLDLKFCFQTNKKLIYVTEFTQGGDLSNLVERKKYLTEEETCFYTAEIALAINYLHEKNIIHRDVKLENILVCCDGHIKLSDYGLCKTDMVPGLKTKTYTGTLYYMAPEILKGEPYDFAVDWWSLGMAAYVMLMGVFPYNEQTEETTDEYRAIVTHSILHRNIKVPTYINKDIRSFINGLLVKNPLNRLGSPNMQGFNGIITHQFFYGLNWKLLKMKKVKPPIIPDARDPVDLQNFASDALGEPNEFSYNETNRSNIVQTEFNGFDYFPI